VRSPRDRRRQKEQEIRRADVLAAASRIFGEKGYDGAQIAEIAQAAEVSLASVYSLFEGKEDIYQAVILSAADSIRQTVRDKIEPIPDPAERLLGLVDSLFDCFEENRDLLRIYARSTAGLPWRIRNTMGDAPVAIFHEFTDWVVGLCRQARKAGYLEGIDPQVFALSLIGSITTSAAHAIENDPDAPLTRSAPAVRAIAKRVLTSEEPV